MGPRKDRSIRVTQWRRRGSRALWLEKQPADWRSNFENVPITPIEKGGPEHRFGVQVAGGEAGDAPERTAAAHPLDRPVATWSEQDVRVVLSSPAYLEPQHLRRERAQRLGRAWFERRFGTEVAAHCRAAPAA